MSNVEFDEGTNEFTSRRILGSEVVPGMVRALEKTGLVKNSNQAKFILVGIILICILTAILVPILTGPDRNPKSVAPKNYVSPEAQRAQYQR